MRACTRVVRMILVPVKCQGPSRSIKINSPQTRVSHTCGKDQVVVGCRPDDALSAYHFSLPAGRRYGKDR